MRNILAACMTATLLLGGTASYGTVAAQDAGARHHIQGKDPRYNSTKRDGKHHRNVKRKRGDDKKHYGRSHDRKKYGRHDNRKRYGRQDNRGNHWNQRRTSSSSHGVYRGKVYRNHRNWQHVPPRYSHRYRARPGYRYYRVGNDIVLVAIATGLVVNVLANAAR